MKLYKKLQNILKRYREVEQQDIDYETAKIIMKNEENVILADVRSKQEYEEGHLEGSINIPLYDLEKNIETLDINKEDIIIFYCQYGARSKRALKILQDEGYEHLYQLKGGLDEI